MNPQRIIIRLRQLAITMAVSPHVLDRTEVDVIEDMIADGLLVRLSTAIYSQQLEPQVLVADGVDVERECWQVPRGWLDYLVLRHPRLRGFLGEPQFVVVRHESSRLPRQVTIERQVIYPDAAFMLPSDRWGHGVYVESLTGD